MTIWMIVGLAALTYASRATAVVFLPEPSERVQSLLERVPAPLFAGFAAISLVDTSGNAVPAETYVAVIGAIAAARTRSLLVILGAGIAGYVIAAAVRALV